MSWCRLRRLWKQTPPLSKVSKFTGEAWMNPPPTALLPSCFTHVTPIFFFSLFLLSPSVSWNITVGQKSPHWCLQGCIMRINELEVNMQAVCCLRLYTSQPVGFHQKLRWIASPKAPAFSNTRLCSVLFILSRTQRPVTFHFYSFGLSSSSLKPLLCFIWMKKTVTVNMRNAFAVSFHTNRNQHGLLL